jgi:hypothetical protein
VSAERAPAQASAEQFHAIYGARGLYPLIRAARTFKTRAGRVNQARRHGSNLRSGAWKSYVTRPG